VQGKLGVAATAGEDNSHVSNPASTTAGSFAKITYTAFKCASRRL
jgi:hypothetical protein